MTDPELQYRVLNQLDNDPHMTQRQLADVLGEKWTPSFGQLSSIFKV